MLQVSRVKKPKQPLKIQNNSIQHGIYFLSSLLALQDEEKTLSSSGSSSLAGELGVKVLTPQGWVMN